MVTSRFAQLAEVRSTRSRALHTVNAELIQLYWTFGAVVQQQAERGWCSKVIDRLAADLTAEFPDMHGLVRFSHHRLYVEATPGIHNPRTKEIPRHRGLGLSRIQLLEASRSAPPAVLLALSQIGQTTLCITYYKLSVAKERELR
jgi:hypothetical protein